MSTESKHQEGNNANTVLGAVNFGPVPKSTLYSYAIIAQPIHEQKRYLWQKTGRYKKLSDAEKAIIDFTNEKVATLVYRIIPYFEGFYWVDTETEKHSYKETNNLLFKYLDSKGLSDEARSFLEVKRDKVKKRWIFF